MSRKGGYNTGYGRSSSSKRGSGFDYDDLYAGDNVGLMADHDNQQSYGYDQFDEQIESNGMEIQERDEAVAEIENTMMEVNEIYRDLSTLVNEQGEQLDCIESNMTTADTNVENGVGQLVKASKYQKKARSKMCCFLICGLVALAILVVILITTLKKSDDAQPAGGVPFPANAPTVAPPFPPPPPPTLLPTPHGGSGSGTTTTTRPRLDADDLPFAICGSEYTGNFFENSFHDAAIEVTSNGTIIRANSCTSATPISLQFLDMSGTTVASCRGCEACVTAPLTAGMYGMMLNSGVAHQEFSVDIQCDD